MNNIEFIEYIPVTIENQKHLAVVAVKWSGIVLRFKIMPTKDGTGFFPATASVLVKDIISGEEKYQSAFEIDSRSEHERVLNFVKAVYKKMLSNQSAFASSIPSASGYALPANANYPQVDQNRHGGMVMQETQQTMPF